MVQMAKAKKSFHEKSDSFLDSILRKLFFKTVDHFLKNPKILDLFRRNLFVYSVSLKFLEFLRGHLGGSNSCVRNINLEGTSFKILLNPKNGSVDKQILAFLNYEPKISSMIKKYSNKNEIFVDVGANIGYHSIYASRFFKKVIAFEPVPFVFQQFKESIKINEFNNIVVHNCACSNKQGKSTIYIDKDVGGSSLSSDLLKRTHVKKIETNTIVLDRFLKTKSKIGVIKMDVEGSEPLVFEGIKKIIKKQRPTIIMEFFPTLIDGHGFSSGKFLKKLMEDHKVIEIETNKEIINSNKHIEKLKKHHRFSNLLLINKKIK